MPGFYIVWEKILIATGYKIYAAFNGNYEITFTF